jgi:hypothetical protein
MIQERLTVDTLGETMNCVASPLADDPSMAA